MKRASRRPLAKAGTPAPAPVDAAAQSTEAKAETFQPHSVRWHRQANDGVLFACSAKDHPSAHAVADPGKGPLPRLEPDVMLELSDAGSEPEDDTRRKHRYLVRAVVRADLPAGTVSCQEEFARHQQRWLSKGSLYVRRVPSFKDAAAAYDLEHLELSFSNSFVSRSDMLEANLALTNRPLFVGQEVYVTGFTFTVKRMIRRSTPLKADSGPEPLPLSRDAHKGSVTDLTSLYGYASPLRGPRTGATASPTPAALQDECENGLVTSHTHVSFESLSFVTTCLFCVSSELDNVMVDGRTAFDWAVDGLMRDYARKLEEDYKAMPTLQVVLFGVVAHGDAARENYVTSALRLTQSRELADLPRELKRQVMLFRRRAAERSCIKVDDFSFFAPAGHSNFLDAVNVVLERFGKHSVNRALHITGHSLFTVTAGRGFFCVPDVHAAEFTARRVHDIGIKTCTVICTGRPPLHPGPLFEFEGSDQSLASQRNLRVDRRRLYYSQPKWITCLYYYGSPRRGFGGAGEGGGASSFDLFTRKQWIERFGDETGMHGRLSFPAFPRPQPPYAFATGVTAADLSAVTPDRTTHFSRLRLHAGSHALGGMARGSSGISAPTASPPLSSLPHMSAGSGGGLGHGFSSLGNNGSELPGSAGGGAVRGQGSGEPLVVAMWSAPPEPGDESAMPTELVSLLDTDIAHSQLTLHMGINARAVADGSPAVGWNPKLATDPGLWSAFVGAFVPRLGDAGGFVERKHEFMVQPMARSVVGADLYLVTTPCPDIVVEGEEEVIFVPQPGFFVSHDTGQPLADLPVVANGVMSRSPVCYLTPLWATVFAFQPVHPYTGAAERASRGHDELMTNEAMSHRWSYRFPSRTRARDRANWDLLCRCPLMPIRCPPDTVITNQLSFVTDAYSRVDDPGTALLVFTEMVFQRLTQGFQLVSYTETAATLTMGHQTHRLCLTPETGSIDVETSQHRGVWHTPARVRNIRFLRWNYLAKNFEECNGLLGTSIGLGHQIVAWADFDDEVIKRTRVMSVDAPTRNIAYAMLPADPTVPMNAQALYEFLDGRFSTMLTRAAADEHIPYFTASDGFWDSERAAPVPVPVDIEPSSFAPPAATSLSSGSPPGIGVPVHAVQLEQPATSDKMVSLHRRRFAAEAAAVQPPVLARERGMFVNVMLSDIFDPRSCFTVRAQWTICTGSVLADWDNHIRLVASDHGFTVVRIPCAAFDALGTLDFSPTLTLQWHALMHRPQDIVQQLCHNLHYFPERLPVTTGTRLIHASGLAIVLVVADGLCWGENSLMPTGTATHLDLYHAFLRLCRVSAPLPRLELDALRPPAPVPSGGSTTAEAGDGMGSAVAPFNPHAMPESSSDSEALVTRAATMSPQQRRREPPSDTGGSVPQAEET